MLACCFSIDVRKEVLMTEVGSAVYAISKKTPVGRLGRPEDIAECYMWLMKDYNVTGFVAGSDAGSKFL